MIKALSKRSTEFPKETNYRFCPFSWMPIIVQPDAFFSIFLVKSALLSRSSARVCGTDHARMDYFCIKFFRTGKFRQPKEPCYACPAYQLGISFRDCKLGPRYSQRAELFNRQHF